MHRTSNTEAYNQYLLGRQLSDDWKLERAKRAVNAYRKAIELDPKYAAAYAGFAMAEADVAGFSGDAAGIREAVAAAEEAVTLAPDEADGYAARGQLRYLLDWNWAGARADLEKSLSYYPGDAFYLRKYGELMSVLGRLPEATTALEQATESDPLSAEAWRMLGFCYTVDRRFAAAHGAFRRLLELRPDSLNVPYTLGLLELVEGHASQALQDFRNVASEAVRLSGIAMADHTLGHARESQQALDELLARDAQRGAYQIAQVYAWRGEKDRAFDWLERAYRQRDGGLILMKTDPELASLRDDARFAAMLAKMNL
jgi:tetratricopeptide (TPR) repeat protein